MNPKLQKRVQRYGWDKASGTYERYWAEQLKPAQKLMLELAGLKKGQRVVDLACGTGLVSIRAAELVGSEGHVHGTDISEDMITAARERARIADLGNITFERMDGESTDVPEEHYDAALCGLGLMYFPDPEAACRQVLKMIKPGSRFSAAVWGARANCGWADIFPIVDSRVKSEVCPLFFRLGTGDQLRLALEQAGFESVRTERISTILNYKNGEDACGAAFEGGPVALAYSRFDQDTKNEAKAEYLESISPFKTESGYEIPGEFVVSVGTRPKD